MFYKLQYHISDDPKPHQRYYNALSSEVATEMFKATCDGGSLTGENVTLISVERYPLPQENHMYPPSGYSQ